MFNNSCQDTLSSLWWEIGNCLATQCSLPLPPCFALCVWLNPHTSWCFVVDGWGVRMNHPFHALPGRMITCDCNGGRVNAALCLLLSFHTTIHFFQKMVSIVDRLLLCYEVQYWAVQWVDDIQYIYERKDDRRALYVMQQSTLWACFTGELLICCLGPYSDLYVTLWERDKGSFTPVVLYSQDTVFSGLRFRVLTKILFKGWYVLKEHWTW